MTAPSHQFQLIDHRLGGKLEDTMAALFVEAGSWEQVSRRLLTDHGEQVSGQTLRRWARQLGINGEAA